MSAGSAHLACKPSETRFVIQLLSGFLVPGTVLGTKDKAVNKTKIPQSWNIHSSKDREI